MRANGGIHPPGAHVDLFAHDDRHVRVMRRDRDAGALRPSLVRAVGGDRHQRHHAVAGVRMLVVARLGVGKLLADAAERAQHVPDRHGLAVPRHVRRRHGSHGLCHSLPSAWTSLSASGGPHVPDG